MSSSSLALQFAARTLFFFTILEFWNWKIFIFLNFSHNSGNIEQTDFLSKCINWLRDFGLESHYT